MGHSTEMNAGIPSAESLPNEEEYAKMLVAKEVMDGQNVAAFMDRSKASPISYRRVLPEDLPEDQSRLVPYEKRQMLWLRAKGDIQEDRFHPVALAYASDHSFLMTSLLVNNIKLQDIAMMASLDHSSMRQ